MRLRDAEELVWAEARRAVPQVKSVEMPFLDELFDKQKAFVSDDAREKYAIAPRRAGKTTLVLAYAFKAALHPETVAKRWVSRGVPPIVRYWAITRDKAKEQMWGAFKRFNERWGLGGEPDETALILRFPNGGEIRLCGADNQTQADRKRGEGTVLELIDEASVYGSHFRSMVEEVILPSLADFKGVCCLFGTPGIVCRGYWYDVSGPKAVARGWSRHSWDITDNPHIDGKGEVERILRRNNWTRDNPTFLREWCGQWVDDSGARYYSWTHELNEYDGVLPTLPRGKQWTHAIGWDLGGSRKKLRRGEQDRDDPDGARPQYKTMALMVWAWSDGDPYLYERYSRRGFESLKAIADQDRALEAEYGNVLIRKADCGALGGVIADEFFERFGIYYESADKQEKYANVQLMNDVFMAGGIKTIRGSTLSDEYASLPKDPEDPLEAHPRFPNHCSDAGLYTFRAIKFEFKPPEEILSAEEQREKQRREVEEREVRGGGGEQGREWWE